MQRVRMSLPYYQENGWDPVILTVEPADHGGIREDALLSTVPAGIIVHRCHAFSLKWTRWLGVGNLGLRCWLQLFFAGRRLIRREKIDLVFFSNTQFVTFTLGRIWRCLFGVPYLIDLQDPWRTNHYTGARKKDRPGGWKYEFARLQAAILERWSFRHMSGLMTVSQSYLDDLQRRYRWFSSIPTEVIGFGASEADQAAAAKIRPPMPTGSDAPHKIVYTGVAGPVMQPALEVLFDGLKAFRNESHSTPKLNIQFLGTSYAAADAARPSVSPIACAFGTDDLVSETPTRLGFLQTLSEQAATQALLLLGTSDPAYSASKLYPYYLSGRPMLAVVLAGSYLERLLRELSCAVIVTFEPSGPTAQTRAKLTTFFTALLSGFPPGSLPSRNDELFRRKYLARSLTLRQCGLFDQAFSGQVFNPSRV
jgi:hypothetical protein